MGKKNRKLMAQKYTKSVIKNPTWEEYFKVKKVDGYVRGFYNHVTDDVWIYRGDIVHSTIKAYMKGISKRAWKFVLETKRFTITGPKDNWLNVSKEIRRKVVFKMKELEPKSNENKKTTFRPFAN